MDATGRLATNFKQATPHNQNRALAVGGLFGISDMISDIFTDQRRRSEWKMIM
jgi:hypothetical protein